MSSSSTSSAGKQPRSSRACVQCRTRKQRCLPELPGVPCQRCKSAHKTCSFETDVEYRLAYAPYPSPSPGQNGSDVHALRLELAEHRRRLDILEGAVRSGSLTASTSSTSINDDTHTVHPKVPTSPASTPMSLPTLGSSPAETKVFATHGLQYGSPAGSGSSGSSGSPRPTKRKLLFDDCTLEAPISTLRNLSTLSYPEDPATGSTYPPSPDVSDSFVFDPVERGVLSMEDAERCFGIFFEHLHQVAPLLCVRTQSSAVSVRARCSVLFTSICAVGARFWDHEAPPAARAWLHPRYRALVSLVDEAIGSLLLRATPADVTVESIQALLVYLQWMPLDGTRSRFNDVSAWSIAGLAIRHAHYIGLDRSVQANYGPGVKEDDIFRLRVWLNLLSVDHHLMVNAAMPASLNPEPAARVCRNFGTHALSQPTDIKAAALCELVCILNRAAKSCGDPSLRRLDPISLRRANGELDDWEKTWTVVLPAQSTLYMPFTALRWYRLSLNSGSLNSALARPDTPAASIGAVELGIEAAAQMLFHFSLEAVTPPVRPTVRGSHGPFTLAHHALAAFQFAIDSYWTTHAFSVVLLALAYTRGLVDDDLNVLSTPIPKTRPRTDALLPSLLRLAAAAFRGVCAPGAAHCRALVDNTLDTLLVDGQANGIIADVENMFPEMLDLGIGFDWAFFQDSATGYDDPMNTAVAS